MLSAETGSAAAAAEAGQSMTGGDTVALIAAGALLLLALGLVAAEEALSRLSTVRAQALAESSPRGAARLEALLVEPEMTRTPLRLIILTAEVVQAVLVAQVAFRLLPTAAAVAAVAVDLLVTFVLAEAMPRTLAILHTDRVGLLVSGPVTWLLRLAPIRLLAGP